MSKTFELLQKIAKKDIGNNVMVIIFADGRGQVSLITDIDNEPPIERIEFSDEAELSAKLTQYLHGESYE